MAIFNKDSNRKTSTTNTETTVIAAGAQIKGNFEFACRLHVDGEIEGTIDSHNIIVIGKKGIIKGSLKADKLVVNGIFEGDATCLHVEILEGGIFKGNVTSEELIIESKAKFEGESKMNMPNSSSEKEKHVPSSPKNENSFKNENRPKTDQIASKGKENIIAS